MQSLVCLRLGPGVSDQGLVHLRELVGLRELRLDSAADVSDEGLAHLTGLTGLEELSLQYTGISDAGLASLAGLVHLAELTLDGTEITDAGLKAPAWLRRAQEDLIEPRSGHQEGSRRVAEGDSGLQSLLGAAG